MSLATTSPDAARWLSFDLAGQRYAVGVRHVQEVIRPSEITPVPGSPGDVLGIINLRGAIVAVLDGRRRLGIAANGDDRALAARILVFDLASEPIGVLVDAINDVIELAPNDVSAAPGGRSSRADDPVTGVVQRGEDFVALMDAARLCRATPM